MREFQQLIAICYQLILYLLSYNIYKVSFFYKQKFISVLQSQIIQYNFNIFLQSSVQFLWTYFHFTEIKIMKQSNLASVLQIYWVLQLKINCYHNYKLQKDIRIQF
ncbi:hypothetical protein pb186bvf_011211 [Paramecium bursaria]